MDSRLRIRAALADVLDGVPLEIAAKRWGVDEDALLDALQSEAEAARLETEAQIDR
jgi:hypothetical protein